MKEKRTEAVAPGLGNVMMGIQQPHAKLWYAVKRHNWALATYELGDITEGLASATDLFPDFKGIPVSKLIPTSTQAPFAVLDKALNRKNAFKVAAAYDALTAGCNECHRAAMHPFLRLQRLGPGQFSDQVFHP